MKIFLCIVGLAIASQFVLAKEETPKAKITELEPVEKTELQNGDKVIREQRSYGGK